MAFEAYNDQKGSQAGNGSQVKKWQKKGRKFFRALCAMAIKVARLKKGGQVEKRRSGIKMAEKEKKGGQE